MSVEVALGTPLAEALNLAIQGKIAELGWAGPGTEGSAMSEYFLLMLANGKTESEIAAEIAGDLLQLGPEDHTAPAFAGWLFGQIGSLSAQLGAGPAQSADAMDGVGDDQMDDLYASMDASSDAPATALNAPTGPKAMRNRGPAGGREKRMMGQINRALDRTQDSVLHRVRTQSGNERIGRGPPAGPRMGVGRQPRAVNARATSIAAGLANQNAMFAPHGQHPGMNGMGPMNPMGGAGYGQADIYAMMEQQNQMLQQMQQQLIMQQQQGGQRGGYGRGGKHQFDRGGRPNQFRQRGGHHQNNGHGDQQQHGAEVQADNASQADVEMGGAKREAPNPDDTVCRFNLRCQNKDCKFAHQSPAAPPGAMVDVNDVCTFGAACKNRKCVGRHPSPAAKMAHQSEQDCKFFPNCVNPHCPFRHPTMPACRNGGECKVANCKFTHVKTPCKFHPCTNRSCPFMHEEGQRGTFHDKVWTAEDGATKEHVSERKFVDEAAGPEDVVLPESGEHHHSDAEVIISFTRDVALGSRLTMYVTSSRSIARALGRPGAGRSSTLCSFSGHFSGCLTQPPLQPHHHHRAAAYATHSNSPTGTPSSSQPAPGLSVAKNESSDGGAAASGLAPPHPHRNIAILGSGLTGLSAAWYLARALPQAKITLYEASGRLGGWIDTKKVDVEQQDGSVARVHLERAARMVKPLTRPGPVPRWDDLVFFDLVAKLGLADQLELSRKKDEAVAGFLYYPDHLVEIPMPPPIKTLGDLFRKVPVLARMAKLLFEPVFRGLLPAVWRSLSAPRSPLADPIFYGEGDISIGDYYSQRHGTPDVVDKVLSALMHGTAGGDVWKLSMASSSFADTLAPENRGPPTKVMVRMFDLQLMVEHLKDPETFDLANKHLGSSSLWFRNGFSTLTDALGKALAGMPNVTIRLNDPATKIQYSHSLDQVQLTTKKNQQPVAYDKVISTLLAKDLVSLTGNTLPSLASETAVTIMLVNLWYPTPHLNAPYNGFGYLIPQAISLDENPELVLGVIFDSDREFPPPTQSNPSPAPRGADSVQGTKLTVLMGGHLWDDLPASAIPDEQTAIDMAKRAVARHLRLPDAVAASPRAWAKLCRDCLPQHLVGHRSRMRDAHFELRSAFAGRLAVAGGSYQPPGVLGALRAGRDVGLQVADGGAPEGCSAASVGDTGLMRDGKVLPGWKRPGWKLAGVSGEEEGGKGEGEKKG
ncbi:hypothetical protein C8A05DRAFT_40524 [Staphylotrichum tortipilum]|uniref:protoporphyrinogen oxidase n=1 Tax=Staphylotrichum tortipilum TaxID=2831512 RepID=A0AAN6RY26_9PEZI|nr:hypothetical protein C8A05DRAFT_40524 [Staphylotrichum longicolle]